MIYAISDLHGCYNKYQRMLNKIELKKDDTLYILGDVVDRGKNGIKILFDMMKRPNIVPILGNHDYMAFSVLRYATKKAKPSWWQSMRDDWHSDGGLFTESSFMELSEPEQKKILSYIADFSVYETVEIENKTYVLTHAGINNFEKGKDLNEYELYDFISGRPDYGTIYTDEFYLVSGHTPTALIDKAYDGRIYVKNNHIAIDCGAVFKRPLGCICLDTMKEFYVD